MLYAALRNFVRVIGEAYEQFTADRGQNAAAALAFFSLLSMAPTILIAVAVAGFLIGESSAQEEVRRLILQNMGAVAAKTVDGWVTDAADGGGTASAVALGLILLTASQATSQLRESLNQVWNVGPDEQTGFKHSVLQYLKRQGLALGLVLGSGVLLLAVFVSRVSLAVIPDVLLAGSSTLGSLVAGAIQVSLSLVTITAAASLVFRVVPDAPVDWNSALKGGLLTSVLFNVGNYLVGLYLGSVGSSQSYGLAGSVVVVLLWLYYSAQMMLFGAEVTQICSEERAKARGADTQAKRRLPLKQEA